ncbi:MAG: DUF6481 family protein [Sphingomonas adhaesiva]|uniref:DUF6481 family protein n=1 Tax=Sphingomonas adhaesiva TaxID=28212 RepID=UPI002FF494BE
MARFKTPDFNERSAAARAAKESALEKLRNKPVADPAVIAEREATRAARDAAAAERRAERQRLIDEEKAAKAAAKAAEEAARAPKPKKSAEELKALRDLKYAARKARKK